MATNRPWALVTGASAGIGTAFARELARRGHDLVLTARRAGRLQTLAGDLGDTHGVQVVCLPDDLADPQAPARIAAALVERGIVTTILINNAGYGVPGSFLANPWQRHADFIQVMVTAPTELCHRLLPAMRERGHGRIVNVASLAGHLPGTAGHTLYAAVKAYLIRYSQSLALENRRHGVNVSAVCPGFTYSEFHDVTGTRPVVSRMPKWMWMDADSVARQGLDAVERGDAVFVPGRVNRTIKRLFDLMPDRLALRMVERRAGNFRNRGEG